MSIWQKVQEPVARPRVAREADDDVAIEAEEDSTEFIPLQYSITSYGADYPVDGLVRRMKDSSIFVPTFQRGYVWDHKEASRFIESLLLGLPVPGIFLSREQDSQKLLVIDGQQRLTTLNSFYEGRFPSGKPFTLKAVQKRFEGRTYATLDDEDRRRLDDSILHATIIRQDEPENDDSSVYEIFERLNTGGTLLRPQEIRSSINHGPFSDLLKQLNEDTSWRAVYGEVSKNMRDQELILRFLALYYLGSEYRKPMTAFLNSYMHRNRVLQLQNAGQIAGLFTSTIGMVYQCLGATAFKLKAALNAAVFDAVMVGLARRLAAGPINDCDAVLRQYRALTDEKRFADSTLKATSDEESVSTRIALATSAFANVP